jgi:hypothetical protein
MPIFMCFFFKCWVGKHGIKRINFTTIITTSTVAMTLTCNHIFSAFYSNFGNRRAECLEILGHVCFKGLLLSIVINTKVKWSDENLCTHKRVSFNEQPLLYIIRLIWMRLSRYRITVECGFLTHNKCCF